MSFVFLKADAAAESVWLLERDQSAVAHEGPHLFAVVRAGGYAGEESGQARGDAGITENSVAKVAYAQAGRAA